MAVNFDYTPSYSSQVAIKPRMNLVRFGDGYVQRNTMGINIFPKVYQLQFNGITSAQADAMEQLLILAAGGTINFKLPPAKPEDPYIKWICPEGWTRTKADLNSENFVCVFEQVFE